jgi:hypothetical protein
MRIYLAFLPLIFLLSCSRQYQRKNDLLLNNLKGPVKLLEQNTYSAIKKFGDIFPGPRKNELGGPEEQNMILVFNTSGLTIEKRLFTPGGEFWEKQLYKYDKEDRLIDEKGFDSSGKQDYSCIYTFDKKSNTVLLEINNHSSLGSQSALYYLDKSGNIIKEEWYDKKGSLVSVTKYQYGSQLHPIGEQTYNSKGDIEFKNGFILGSDGNLKQETRASIINHVSANTYTYKYDLYNNIIEKATKTSITVFKYEYDQNHNWTKRIRFAFTEPVELTIRRIEYY